MRIMDLNGNVHNLSMDDLRGEYPDMVISHGLIYEASPRECIGPTYRIIEGGSQ